MTEDLYELFMQARSYGLVDLSTLDGGTYSCTILVPVEQREMRVKSGFAHLTPHAAIKAAILVAASIRGLADTKTQRCPV